jgi:hypothetical protein
MGAFEDFLNAYAGYEMGEKGIESARDIGERGYGEAMGLAGEAAGMAKFQPFTVTTGLGTTTTTPTGGLDIGLSPEQQALQTQLMGQAQGLFGQVGVDPSTAQADLYEQMRAVQRPEEERQRLALEERMLSQGRLGLQSAAYGGSSPELLAQETARQEAMARANLGARTQSMAEQAQALSSATGLLGAGYSPQQQALDALARGTQVAGLADIGRRTGAELFGRLGQSGVEALIQGEDLASRLQQQQMQSLADALLGRQPTIQEQILGQIYDVDTSGGSSLLDTLGGLFGGLFNSNEEEDVDIGKILQDALDAKGGQQ